MTTIGFIGSGHIGSALARLAVANGYDVVMSNSRGPETLGSLVTELGEHASAATADEAGARGDIVVVTIPVKAVGDIPVGQLDGKVVIDTNNYYPQRDGQIAALDDESLTSAELLQQRQPGSRVVKAFNHIGSTDLAAQGLPAGDPNRRALAIAGDDTEAKQTVTALIDLFGFDAVDAGALSEGWHFQVGTAAYGPRFTTAEMRTALGEARRTNG